MFLGVDASLNGTGLALLNYEGKLVASDCLHPPSKYTSKGFRGKRLVFIANNFQEFVETFPGYKIQLAGIESGAYSAVSKHHQLGKVLGISELLLQRNSIPYFYVEPSRVRKFILGKGNASKEDAHRYMCRFAGIEPGSVTLDESDAYVIARLARIRALQDEPRIKKHLSSYQQQTLKELLLEEV